MLAARRRHSAHAEAGSTRAAPLSYERRRPENTLLYRTLQEHWRTFLATPLDQSGEPPALPAFVTAEVEAFLRCGIPAHGFVRTRCTSCGHGTVVPFSCKRRGFCPSCIGRRMADAAAHMVDHVLPHVPFRQWVLTLPYALRLRTAYDPALASWVLRTFVRALSRWLKRSARRRRIRGPLKTGGVTVIQRFSSSLDLNVHFHTLMLDGVYRLAPGAPPDFIPLPAPTDEEVAAITAAVARKVVERIAVIDGRGIDDAFAADQPALLAVAAASVMGRVVTGPRRGCRTLRIRGAPASQQALVVGRRCAQVDGFNLHANVRVSARDRAGLETLCRYLARPPIAGDRLSAAEDGRLLLTLKRPWSDGTTDIALTPTELIERLVALVPRPRHHLTRYHGVLAPAFAARSQIVPRPAGRAAAPAPPGCAAPSMPTKRPRSPLPPRHPWAHLLWRVFRIDVLQCPRCPGRMDIVAAVTQPEAVVRYLTHIGLPSEAPRIAPARPPPQIGLHFEDGAPPLDVDPNVDPPAPDDL